MKVFDVSSGQRKDDMETWLWNEEVQESIQGKRLAKNKMGKLEDSQREYKEM